MHREFQNKLNEVYDVDYYPIDMNDIPDSFNEINQYINNMSNGAIRYIVGYDDLADKQMLMISANYFEGKWEVSLIEFMALVGHQYNKILPDFSQSPFNVRKTAHEMFVDDENSIRIVNMMHQRHTFPHADIVELKAQALELPYEDRYSMLILLPWKNSNLKTMLEQLRSYGIEQIVQQLYANDGVMVDVALPQFSVSADFTLNIMLEEMGLIDIFNATKANLSKISDEHVYLSRIIHRSLIMVNENGGSVARDDVRHMNLETEEPALIQFSVDRPFAFFIMERYTNTLLFCGEVRKPDHV